VTAPRGPTRAGIDAYDILVALPVDDVQTVRIGR
jgi:hypothetical protein